MQFSYPFSSEEEFEKKQSDVENGTYDHLKNPCEAFVLVHYLNERYEAEWNDEDANTKAFRSAVLVFIACVTATILLCEAMVDSAPPHLVFIFIASLIFVGAVVGGAAFSRYIYLAAREMELKRRKGPPKRVPEKYAHILKAKSPMELTETVIVSVG